MPVINMGSINVDHVYQVDAWVRPGETKACQNYSKGLGGKGINQSIALHRAGVKVCHVGAIAEGDDWVLAQIARTGVATDAIAKVMQATGHAVIQVNAQGENCIILAPGANHALQLDMLHQAFNRHPDYDWLLLQNEINLGAEAIAVALAAGRKVALNPAPCTPELAQLPLEKLSLLIVNEIEAQQLSQQNTPSSALQSLRQRCPNTLIVMTLGADGIHAARGAQDWTQAAVPTQVVDTTAAGDTVTGYILAALDAGLDTADALHLAAKAAALTVSRKGAADSIPLRSELA